VEEHHLVPRCRARRIEPVPDDHELVAIGVGVPFERGTDDVEEFEMRAVRERAEHPPLRVHDSRLRRAIVR
jgi:hypothetical protein